MAAESYPSGFLAALVALALAFMGVIARGWIYIGYHKKTHEAEAAFNKETALKVSTLQEAHDIRTAMCPIHIVEAKQAIVFESVESIQDKLDHLIDRTNRIERLEAKMDASEKDRSNMNAKLDRVIENLGELRGALGSPKART